MINAALRRQFHEWCPPVVARLLRRARSTPEPVPYAQFQGDYANWDEAVRMSTGYTSEHILAKVLEATLKVKRGEAAFERDSVVFSRIEYCWPTAAALMTAAATTSGRLNVVDFGGALGSTYFQYRQFFSCVPEINWVVIEQPHFVKAGIANIADDVITFRDSVTEVPFSPDTSVLYLSGVLPYVPDPHGLLDTLLSYPWNTIIVDRTQLCKHLSGDRLTVQKVPDSIYAASYPAWFFSDIAFRQRFQPQYKLLLEWRALDTYDLDGVIIPCTGILYRRS